MKKKESTHNTANKTLCNMLIAVFSFAIGGLMCVPLCQAQLMNTGTINGTVTDQSGSIVQGAKVNITDVGTKTVTQTVSNSDGRFSQVGLESGNYEVTVSSTGFASFREKGIYLEPAGTYTVNVVLKPGAATATVTVTGTRAQVQTTTDEISNTVSGKEAQTLPLNGRNYQQLGSLMPGVINMSPDSALGTGGFNTYNALNVNGGGSTGSLYTVDGIWNENTGDMQQTTIMPNPDEIAQIKVLQNNYSAKYTLMGASVVMVQTKSGTDQFHGGGWEFLRNTALDATPYFTTKPTVLHWNIFGWNLGGPLFVPHLYNTNRRKTFFYFNQQFVRQSQASVLRGASPTLAMRHGDFSAFKTIKDPQTGKPFPGNQIPASRINQKALALLNAMAPLPNNVAGGFDNYINLNPATTKQMDVMTKVDHNISTNLRLTGEYFYEGQTTDEPSAGRMGSPFSSDYDVFRTDNQLAKVQLEQILSPSMANQTSIAMNNYDITHDLGGTYLLSQIPGYSQTLPYTGGYLQNYLPHITFAQGWSQFGASSCCIIPRATDLEDTVADDWSWLRGKHFLEAGFTMLFGTKRQWATGGLTNGDFSFNGQFTGNAIADYLLGDTNSFSQSNNGFRKYIHYPIASPYVEDQWRATRRLTITGGVRFFYMPWPTTQAGYMVSFDPAKFNPANAPIVSTKGVITPTPSYNEANGLIQNGKNGVPLNLTNAHNYYWAPEVGFALDVFGDGRTSLRGGYGITYNKTAGQACAQGCVSYPLVQNTNLINTNFPDPLGGKSAPLTAFGVSGEDLQNYRATQIQTYSLSWQQQFGTNWIVSIAGAGDRSTHVLEFLQINQPPAVTGYNFNPLINTGNYSDAYFSPYKGYNGIGMASSIGVGNWNALEVGVRHPVGNNLYLTTAYTWSHNLDWSGGIQNSYAPQDAYGNSSLNTPQVFTTSIIYSEPWFRDASVWKRTLLSGWQYSDMTTIQSGGFLTAGLNIAHTGLATRPNQVAPLSYPKKLNEWFNKSAFVQPPYGFFGDVHNGTIEAPGVIDFNMAAYKTFPLYREANLQFRAEFFNIFNHTNPNGPNTQFGAGTYGQITSAADPRIGEVALKLNF